VKSRGDFPTADDTLAGHARPGLPGASVAADTPIDWTFARARGRARVPTPAAPGAIATRVSHAVESGEHGARIRPPVETDHQSL